MFNSQKHASTMKQKKSSGARDAAVTILTSGCHFNGKLYCRGSSRIGGCIEGQIISEGLLIIEEEAVITAEIVADEAIIQGRVQGTLQAKGRVELCASSRVDGDISSPILVVKEGAQFNGRSNMTKGSEVIANPGGSAKGRSKSNGKDQEAGRISPKVASPDLIPGVKQSDISVMKGPEVNVRAN